MMRHASFCSLLAVLTICLSGCDRDAGLARPDPGYESFRVESFDLVDRSGDAADESILDGRYTVVDFFFTNCPIFCPGMAMVMQRIQADTAGTDVQLLSISVDGVNDTPEVIDAYADSLGADPDRWRFLTGEREAVRALCEEQFKLGINIDPTRPVPTVGGGSMDFIDHPTRMILVGPDRQILGTYSYTDEDQITTLIARVRRLAID